ncbi:MAG: NAD(P)/FAD-dependent oxidoreductase [Candidatus Eisenbacteria bacterium]|uniref:NADH:ubiquinone reductase (non-electrogenic) n=1 Tax=Eiseniibacteriota bacterium TaxID=2212470 RepID=A0A7Y2H3J4_UNCEI|nr:NAD(P)/FAD-dependent oxidoreductase [Candidatus Eisenbacteria bacterium]
MPTTTDSIPKNSPHVLILGGGFAGLKAARALAKSQARITLVDRRNHHVFQPLLYQVATAALSPADIAAPIRQVLRSQKNCNVILAEATGVDLKKKIVHFERGELEYDYLVIATGVTHSYFGNDAWSELAPGLKTLEEATEIRRRILLAFETAEYEGEEENRRAELTFAIVGGGPTGVELAGAIKEIAAKTIPKDFRNIDTRTTRVILLEGGDRVLAAFDEKLSARAKKDLEDLGVEVRLNSFVTDVTESGLQVGEDFIPANNVFWAAGVEAGSLARNMEAPLDRSGRVLVEKDLSVPGHPEVFVVGDMAALKDSRTKDWVPGVAQAAMQGGHHAGKIIAAELKGKKEERPPFQYKDKGSMATIGKARAVAQIGKHRLTGFVAWVLWSLIHVAFLIEFRNRAAVMLNWVWGWLVSRKSARLIMGDAALDLEEPRAIERKPAKEVAPIK